jgi:hypothetical protein
MQNSERYLIAVAAMDRYRYCGCNCGRYCRYLLPCYKYTTTQLTITHKSQVFATPTHLQRSINIHSSEELSHLFDLFIHRDSSGCRSSRSR